MYHILHKELTYHAARRRAVAARVDEVGQRVGIEVERRNSLRHVQGYVDQARRALHESVLFEWNTRVATRQKPLWQVKVRRKLVPTCILSHKATPIPASAAPHPMRIKRVGPMSTKSWMHLADACRSAWVIATLSQLRHRNKGTNSTVL